MYDNEIIVEKVQEAILNGFTLLKDLFFKPVKWCFEFIFYDTLKDKIEGLLFRLCLAFLILLAFLLFLKIKNWFCENVFNQ